MAEISEDNLVTICILFVSRDLLPPYSEACQFHTCGRGSGESRKWWVRKNSGSSSCMHSLHAIHNQGVEGLTFRVDSNPSLSWRSWDQVHSFRREDLLVAGHFEPFIFTQWKENGVVLSALRKVRVLRGFMSLDCLVKNTTPGDRSPSKIERVNGPSSFDVYEVQSLL